MFFDTGGGGINCVRRESQEQVLENGGGRKKRTLQVGMAEKPLPRTRALQRAILPGTRTVLQQEDFQRVLLQVHHQHNDRVDCDLLHFDYSQRTDNHDGLDNAGRHGDQYDHCSKPKEEIINLRTKLEGKPIRRLLEEERIRGLI